MKRFITMTLAVLLAVTAFAQNLEGTWSYTGNKNEKMNGENNVNGELKAVTTVTLTFSGAAFECTRKADVRMDMVLDQNDPDDSTVGLLVKLNGKNAGTFELADGVLKLIPNKGKPQVDVKTDVEGMPSGGEMLAGMLAGPLKNEMVKELKETEQYKVISATATELTLEEILTKKDIADGKKAETVVFKKK